MSRRKRRAIVAVMLAVYLGAGLSAPAAAQGTGQGPALPKEVKRGKALWIVTADGADRRGRIESVTTAEIVLLVRNKPVTIPFGEIRRIDGDDSVLNGTLWGMLWGGTLWGLMGSQMPLEGATSRWEGAIGFGLVGAGFGALIGVVCDAAIQGRRTIYTAAPPAAFAVHPLVTRRGAGLGVTLRW